jgi:hypothetical protein
VEELLAVQHVREVDVLTLLTESLVLEEIEEVQALWEAEWDLHYELGVLRLSPVLQVLQVAHEVRLVEESLGRQVCLLLTVQVPHMTETLHELKLHLEALELLLFIQASWLLLSKLRHDL